MPETAPAVPSLYPGFLQGLKTLAGRIVEIELEMATLAKTFAIKIPHCPLALYPKVEPPHFGRGRDARSNPRFTGRPRGLYWGRVTRTHIVIHRRGFLNGGMIWKIALRGGLKPLFYGFERQRLYLNRSRSLLVKAREDLRKVLASYAARPLPIPISLFTADLHPLGAREIPLAHGLFALAADAENLRLATGTFLNRAAQLTATVPPPRVRFLLRNVDARRGNRRLYLSTGARRLPCEVMTWRFLRRIGVPSTTRSLYLGLRREAAALNCSITLHRLGLARVRQILLHSGRSVRVRRRFRRRREATA